MKEFVLRMASASEKWNVARFNVPVDLGAWNKPLRTYRADEIKPPEEGAPPPPPPKTSTMRRPFSRPMYPRNVKNIPLHLDDTGDAHTYVGRINKAGESSNTFLLIQNGNEFKVVPTGDWYHFRAKRPFVPMGAEEAEEHMKQMEKQHGGSRWASAGRKGGGKSEDKEDGDFVDESRFTVFGESNVESDDEEKGAKGAKGGKKEKDEDVGDEKEDIDFEETWDDDEGGAIDEPQEEEKKKERKTKDATKQDMRKLIKGLAQLEGDEANIEDSEDEGSEEEREGEEDKGGKKEDAGASSPKDAAKAGGAKRKKGASPATTPASAAKKPKLDAAAKPGGAAAAAAAAEKKAKEPLKLSEESVRQLLARKEQMTTVSVVNYFKAELAADPTKKPELTRIVKSIAKMVEIPPGSGKKFLVLKDKH